MTEHRNDYNVTLAGALNGAFNIQTAFSPIKHIVLLGNYMNTNPFIKNSDTGYLHSHNYEAGIGLYQVIKSQKSKVVLNIAGGYGNGFVFDKYHVSLNWDLYYIPYYQQFLTANYNKYFIQPSVNLHHKDINFSLACKVSQVSMTANGIPDVGTKSKINGSIHFNFPTYEFGFTIKTQTKYLNVFTQYKVFASNSLYYTDIVTNNTSAIGQCIFGVAFGITMNSDNVKNILHPKRVPRETEY